MHIRWPERCYSLLALGVLILALLPATSLAQAPLAHERIAFVTLDYATRTMTLSIADPNGGNLVPLVVDGYFAFPAWSPDGTQIAFIGRESESGSPSLWVVNSDGTNLHAVLEEELAIPDPLCAAWSPDGLQFLFGADTGMDGYTFFTVNADASEIERVPFQGIPGEMTGVAGDIVSHCAVWSPDGSQIAVLGRGDGFPPGQLYVTNADGSVATAFPATTTEGTSFHQLTWSPDGTRVLANVIQGLAGRPSEPMIVTSADGASVTAQIGPPARYPDTASWSPDSSRLVFVAVDTSGDMIPGS
ncbi:MAG TPA: hypothetical protein VER79_10350, partial [Candidatus Limnocylindrales bacterium]|nr:hypothetical protein [Candidatus Limnocylindrales bacterium]